MSVELQELSRMVCFLVYSRVLRYRLRALNALHAMHAQLIQLYSACVQVMDYLLPELTPLLLVGHSNLIALFLVYTEWLLSIVKSDQQYYTTEKQRRVAWLQQYEPSELE